MSNCDACKEIKKTEPVPYIVHESAQARNERTVKRLVIALIVAIVLIFASNAIWLYAWMQYDYESEETVTEYKQDGEGLNIIGDRNTAGIYDESERDD
jgi:hypothetical protein